MNTIDRRFIRCLLRKRTDDEWREDLHPRGKGGKFTSKGSGGSSGAGQSKNQAKGGERQKSTQAPQAKASSTFKRVKPKEFRDTFHAAKAAVAKTRPDAAWRVDSTYSEDDYADMDCHVTRGGSAVAVHNGDIVSVCHNPNDGETRGRDLLRYAVENGGDRLDAFGGLYGFYVKNGFEPVSWCEFDEEYAPEDWVKGRDEPEPVIFFKYTGRSEADIKRDFGSDQHEYTRRAKASSDYDEAKKIRNESMGG